MVPAVVGLEKREPRQRFPSRTETVQLGSRRLQVSKETVRSGQTADGIVVEANVEAGAGFFLERLGEGPPDGIVKDDVRFEPDAPLRGADVVEHRRKQRG